MSNIAIINRVFNREGAAAAAARAEILGEAWVADLIDAGNWNPNKNSGPKPQLSFSDIDRNGDKFIVKVTKGATFLGFNIETRGESGDVVSRKKHGKISLAEARELIGKTISHPVPEGHGMKTNFPGQGPAKGKGK